MKYKTELHIHSVLSGCADVENTADNIVNLAQLLELDIIALSDHNAVENYPAFVEAAKESNILVVPAMEVTTAEDIHVLCIFPTFEAAKAVCDTIRRDMPRYELELKFYNPQIILNEDGTEKDRIDYLLSVASTVDVYSLFPLVEKYGGVAVPAHVDKNSNGMIAMLGCIPDDLGITTVEVSPNCSNDLYNELSMKYRIIRSTDAHSLERLCESDFELNLAEKTVECLIKKLKTC